MARGFSAVFLVLILLLTSLSLVVLSINKGDLNTALTDENSSMEVIIPLAQANIAGFQEGSIFTNTTLTAGYFHTCAILDNADLECWGRDSNGQLGDGGTINSGDYTTAPSSTAIDLGTGRTAVAVSAGDSHTCAILDNGEAKCWGQDYYGQLGDGGSNTDTNAPSSTAIDLGTGRTAVAVSAGSFHTCAILDNGDLKCWGDDGKGQLGDGGSNTNTNVPSSTAIDLGTGRTAVAVSAGYQHTCAILDNGDVKCWGYDFYGQLGDGGSNTATNAPSSTAINLGTGRTAVSVSAGNEHTCAILDNGDLKCWGYDNRGQLGDGGSNTNTNAPSSTAIDLGTGRTAVAISAGQLHTCAILDNADLKCWGRDMNGQLGDGGSNNDTNAPSSTAIDLGTGRTAVAVSAESLHTCAVLDNGDAKCWGHGLYGQLGDGGTNNALGAPSSTAIDLGTGRTIAVSERDLDGDGILNIFEPYSLASRTDLLQNLTYSNDWYDVNTCLPRCSSSQSTVDGGAIILTTIVANNSTSDSDLWIIKIDSSGLEEWNFTYGGQYWDEGYDIIENSAGGYTITGRYSYSSFCDLWILKIDTNGSVIWSEKFGGQNSDYGHSIVESHDGGYVAVGHGYGLGNGNDELIAVKVDSNGTEVWTETFGGSNADYGWDISLTSSNGFIIGGYSYSFSTSSSNGDGWLIHLDSNGSELWSDTYGSINGYEDIYSVDQTTDGGFVAVGSKPIVSTGTRGLWMFKTDINGSILWDYSYATNSGGVFQDLMISSNGDLFALGYSSVNANDLWVIKTNESGIEEFNLSEGGSGVDYGVKIIDINSTIISLIGATSSFGNGSNNPWLLRINYSSSSTFIDSDGDGVEDSLDAFPNDVNETADSDNDGVGDNADAFPNDVNETADSDNDGVGDNADAFPNDVNETADSDNDGVGDNADAFPNDVNETADSDNDGVGDNADAFPNDVNETADSDNDGVGDNADAFPNDVNETADSDNDGVGDNADAFPNDVNETADSDNDGVGDNADAFPNDVNETADSDNDGVGDNADAFPNDVNETADSDNDGVGDNADAFPNDVNETADSDNDGVGDNADAFPNDVNEAADSDNDGVGDNADAFPNDLNETADSDNDGVGDNADAFPNDLNETVDSDNDGVGDNADAFPNDVNETADSDNDGLGDNEDEYPLINNFIDSDGDEVPDLFDDFINDPTQWNDYDGDGYGDYSEGNNSDAFINNESQWSDTDGDGYGDNWGNPTWNQTRLFIWPGQFVENAVLADHCPTEYGNSTANGYFGCPDVDGDGIADIYDDLIPNESENENQSNETETVDSDGDGVEDLFDFCPNTVLDGYVDIDGCLFDSDGDGVDDLKDTCPDTKPNVSVNVNGCEVNDDEGQSFIDSLSSGDQTAVLQTVGAGAVLIALFGFLQTNMVAALLPDSVRWLRVLKGNSKLNKEETRELEYLKSLVQTYYQDPEMLQSELSQLKSELTARYTNSEISKITREKLNTLISDLLAMNAGDLSHIANNDTFFGLGGALSTKERVEYLEQDALMRFDDNAIEFEQELESAQTISSVPLKEMKGQINETDGHEYLEHPTGSDSWYYRNHSTGEWVKWDN